MTSNLDKYVDKKYGATPVLPPFAPMPSNSDGKESENLFEDEENRNRQDKPKKKRRNKGNKPLETRNKQETNDGSHSIMNTQSDFDDDDEKFEDFSRKPKSVEQQDCFQLSFGTLRVSAVDDPRVMSFKPPNTRTSTNTDVFGLTLDNLPQEEEEEEMKVFDLNKNDSIEVLKSGFGINLSKRIRRASTKAVEKIATSLQRQKKKIKRRFSSQADEENMF